MVFKQLVDDDLGCACYLVGDEAAGTCVVIDPPFAVEAVLEEAARREVRVTHVLETHNHADHLSGHGRLALELGIPICIHPAADAEYASEDLTDGLEIEIGDVVVTVLHTPGHRPEHCCFTVADRSRADEPWLVLTGDSLFVGDTARPDLAVAAREGAEELFRSLRRLLELPDGVEVYPGHVAGSLCGVGMSSKPSTTIGFERRFNDMLGLEGVDDFVNASTAAVGLRPPNVARLVALNRGPFVGAPPPLQARRDPNGAVVLDVREPVEFAAGHVPGAINIPLSSSSFGTKAGFVLSPEDPVVVHADSQGGADEAAQKLRAVGFLDLAGYLERPETPARLEPIEIDELARLVDEGAVDVIDVREMDERDGGYIPGSRHIPFRLLPGLGDGLGSERPVVTICSSGSRAAIAASLLAASGVNARPVLDGGVPAWQERGNSTIEFRRCGR